jgi:hypothetical protein
MEVIRIEFKKEINEKLLKMLASFSSDKLKIVYEDSNYQENKRKVEVSYMKLKNGTAKLYSMDEVEEILDKKSLKR